MPLSVVPWELVNQLVSEPRKVGSAADFSLIDWYGIWHVDSLLPSPKFFSGHLNLSVIPRVLFEDLSRSGVIP